MGQKITWIVPHALSQVLPEDVDYRVMLTFLEFYEVSTSLQCLGIAAFPDGTRAIVPLVCRKWLDRWSSVPSWRSDSRGSKLQQSVTLFLRRLLGLSFWCYRSLTQQSEVHQ